MKRKKKRKKGGFRFYRTKEQILDYLKVPPEQKLKWLEEMFRLNQEVARSNPKIAIIQERFRRGLV